MYRLYLNATKIMTKDLYVVQIDTKESVAEQLLQGTASFLVPPLNFTLGDAMGMGSALEFMGPQERLIQG